MKTFLYITFIFLWAVVSISIVELGTGSELGKVFIWLMYSFTTFTVLFFIYKIDLDDVER